MHSFTLAALFVALPLTLAACGSSEPSGTGGSGGSGDGKVRPEGNGQRQSQAAACKALLDAQDARGQALQCTITSRPCPTLIQVMVGGKDCLEYDQGSVQGCVDYYAQQNDCDAFSKALDACLVTAFLDSAPAGCP